MTKPSAIETKVETKFGGEAGRGNRDGLELRGYQKQPEFLRVHVYLGLGDLEHWSKSLGRARSSEW